MNDLIVFPLSCDAYLNLLRRRIVYHAHDDRVLYDFKVREKMHDN